VTRCAQAHGHEREAARERDARERAAHGGRRARGGEWRGATGHVTHTGEVTRGGAEGSTGRAEGEGQGGACGGVSDTTSVQRRVDVCRD
jgi:hypothetical protein